MDPCLLLNNLLGLCYNEQILQIELNRMQRDSQQQGIILIALPTAYQNADTAQLSSITQKTAIEASQNC